WGMHDRRLRLARALRRLGTVTGTVLAVGALATEAFANVPLTPVSQDPYTNTNPDVYHQTEVEPDTFAYGSTIVSVFQTGPFSTGGSDNTGWATSVDGGAYWTHGLLQRSTVNATPLGPYDSI